MAMYQVIITAYKAPNISLAEIRGMSIAQLLWGMDEAYIIVDPKGLEEVWYYIFRDHPLDSESLLHYFQECNQLVNQGYIVSIFEIDKHDLRMDNLEATDELNSAFKIVYK